MASWLIEAPSSGQAPAPLRPRLRAPTSRNPQGSWSWMEEGLSRVGVWVCLRPWEDDLDHSNAQGLDTQAPEACLLLCAEGVICQHTEPCHLRDGQGSLQGSGPLDGEIMQRRGNRPSPTDLGRGRSRLSQVSWNRSGKMTLSLPPPFHSRKSCHKICTSKVGSFLHCSHFAQIRIFLSSTITETCLPLLR